MSVVVLSFALLGYQIALMRILAYAQFYHFSSMIISIALLGFGGAGAVLALFREHVTRRTTPVLYGAPIVCLTTVAITPDLVRWFSIDPFLLMQDIRHVLEFFVFVCLLVVPFFTGALVIGLSFVLYPDRIGRFYSLNLLGSALGIIASVILLELISIDRLPGLLALIALPAVWSFGTSNKWRAWVSALVSVGVGVLLFRASPGIGMSQYKPLARALLLPETRITDRAASPLGVTEVVESPHLRYAPGLSLNFEGRIPPQKGVFHDGEWIGSLVPRGDSVGWRVYEHSTSILPYRLLRPKHVLVLGAGTGGEVLLAHKSGAQSVVGVEMNPELVRIFEEEYFIARNPAAPDSGITVVVEEARSYLQRDHKRYDLIVLPISSGQTASAAGTQAQFENYLLTVESFSGILDHLKDGGIFFVQTWMESPPRASAKVLAMLLDALSVSGISHPEQHLAGIRSWNTVAFAVCRQPLSAEQIREVRGLGRTMGFDLIWLPGLQVEETNRFHKLEQPYLFEYGEAIVAGGGDAFVRQYPFRVESATDDRPYFSHFISWKEVPQLLATYGSGQIPYLELGTFFLATTAAQVALLSLILIGLPVVVLLRSGSTLRSLTTTAIYFGGLGVGYMVAEMVIIQKGILFLGDPIYAVAVVVGSLLLSSSFGSAASTSLTQQITKRRWLLPTVVLGTLALYAIILSPMFSALLGMPPWARLCAFSLVVFPLGFVLGFPFPVGLSFVARSRRQNMALAWGINGCFSVLAASMAVLASMEVGFAVLQIIGLAAYAGAFVALAKEWGPEPPQGRSNVS